MRASYVFAVVVMAASPASATDPVGRPKVVDDVVRCRAISEPAARLACYDAAATTLTEATDNQTIVVLDKAEVQRTRRSLFGFTLPKLPFFGNDRDGKNETKEDKAEVRELATTIRSVAPSGYGLWSLTLAEGGTWRTTEPSRSLEPRAGQSIVIKRGPVGGYMAKVDGERAVRIQRIG